MVLLLIGLLVLAFGCSLIFARDAWWEVQKLGNQMQGQVSERTLAWEVAQMGLGVIAIAISIALIWTGIDRINQPVVPRMCFTVGIDSGSSDDKFKIRNEIRTGCAAAERKDYETARSSFTRALNNIDRDRSFVSYQSPLYKAIEQMNQQLPRKQ
ncbi:hypothetical protein ACQ4M3_12105 [Leptolyngbya sp. AN03gr2]|uniref:hypothetical protein n=1 Tax=unclassified Leptolyngbya TaxID=2650499 RepID=UPI003D31B994